MKLHGFFTIALSLLATTSSAVRLSRRRFGVEHTPTLETDYNNMKVVAEGTNFGAFFGDLSGAAVRAMLAKAGACGQQDVADTFVGGFEILIAGQSGLSKEEIAKRRKLMESTAKSYRQQERNTGSPPSPECSREPLAKILKGLKNAQDPAVKPGTPIPKENSVFFDMSGENSQFVNFRPQLEKLFGAKFQDGKAQDTEKDTQKKLTVEPSLFGRPGPNVFSLSSNKFKTHGKTFNTLSEAQALACDIQKERCQKGFTECQKSDAPGCFVTGAEGKKKIAKSDCDTQRKLCTSLRYSTL